MSEAITPGGMVTNGIKMFGETMLPGASLLMDGNLVNGAAHAALGIAAVTFIAPWAGLIVVADSFSKSVTGKNLWDHVNIGKISADAEVAAA